jgi:hypothetical protein
LIPGLRLASLKLEILAFDQSKAPERIGQGGRTRLWALAKLTDLVSLPRLLRLGGERRGEERGSISNERAPLHHSIT